MHVLLLLLITTTMTMKKRKQKPSEKQVQCFCFGHIFPCPKQFSVVLNIFYSTHRRLDWLPYSFGYPNVDFSAAPIYFLAPNATFGGVEYFPSSQRRQYSAAHIYFLAPNAGEGGVKHFPSSQCRLWRRHPPKTAPRQLRSKSRFFAPCALVYPTFSKSRKPSSP